MSVQRVLGGVPDDVRQAFTGKTALVTGGLGFIGSNLTHALVALGMKVTILDALLEPYGGNQFNIDRIQDQVELVHGNIMDEELVGELVKGKDFIWHLAGQVGYVDSKDKPFVDLDYNGRGNLIMLEAIKEHTPKARILFSSSRLVYGKILTIPVREDHPTDPLSLYGIHKLQAEKYYAYYARNFGLHGVVVRIPNPYGPRQQMKHAKYSIVGWFLRLALEDKTIQIFGDGEQERDYIYIDDIVDALLRLPVNGDAGEVYNLGSHQGVKFVEMVDIILKEIGSGQKENVPWPEDYEKNETGDYIANIDKIKAACGWQPKVNIDNGIKEMADYYKRYQAHYW